VSKARVSTNELKEIITTDIGDSILTANYIDTANAYIDANLSDVGHTDIILKKIELYLAAHLVAISASGSGNIVSYSKVGDAAESYETSGDLLDEGLRSTQYGQTAIWLDTSGTLAALASTNRKAEFRVV